MPVTTELTRKQYACDDDQKIFAFPFGIFSENDLTVIVTNDTTGVETILELGPDYNVTKAGNTWKNGGNVETVKEEAGPPEPYAWPSGYTITIMLALAYEQTADYREGDSFPAEVTEVRLDYVTRLVKQLKEELSRIPAMKKSTAYLNIAVPDPVAEYFLRWKADLSGLENLDIKTAGALSVSDFAKTLIDDQNAAAFLTTLGIDTDLLTLSLPADTTITAFVKTLLDDADASAFLTTLGISAFVKTLLDDADADAFLTTLGISNLSGLQISDYIKTLLDDATAVAARSTLGVPSDPAAGTAGMRTLGTGAQQAAPGDDSRFYGDRTPLDNSVTQAKLADDVNIYLYRSHYGAGNNLLVGMDTERVEDTTTPTKYKEAVSVRAGTLRIKFSLKCDYPGGGRVAHARIYRNGVAVGTERTRTVNTYQEFSEDIAGWRPLDLCQLYVWCSIAQDKATVKEFRVYSNLTKTLEKSILD